MDQAADDVIAALHNDNGEDGEDVGDGEDVEITLYD